ncbi:hypothetical protein LMG9673_04656 [Ralstonia pseudosolanacearum]|nr:hypothetical protein LMG9673_04656 [Ralstonia pseudosolanacearum]
MPSTPRLRPAVAVVVAPAVTEPVPATWMSRAASSTDAPALCAAPPIAMSRPAVNRRSPPVVSGPAMEASRAAFSWMVFGDDTFPPSVRSPVPSLPCAVTAMLAAFRLPPRLTLLPALTFSALAAARLPDPATLPPALTVTLLPACAAPPSVTSPPAPIVTSCCARTAPLVLTAPVVVMPAVCCPYTLPTLTSPLASILTLLVLAARSPAARTPNPCAVEISLICPAVIAPNAVASMARPFCALALLAAALAPAPLTCQSEPARPVPVATGATCWFPAITLIWLPANKGALTPTVWPIRLIAPTVPSIPAPAVEPAAGSIWIRPLPTRKPTALAWSNETFAPLPFRNCGVPLDSVTRGVFVNPAPCA